MKKNKIKYLVGAFFALLLILNVVVMAGWWPVNNKKEKEKLIAEEDKAIEDRAEELRRYIQTGMGNSFEDTPCAEALKRNNMCP